MLVQFLYIGTVVQCIALVRWPAPPIRRSPDSVFPGDPWLMVWGKQALGLEKSPPTPPVSAALYWPTNFALYKKSIECKPVWERTYDLPKYEHGINVYIWWFQLRAVKTRVGPFGVDCPKITPFLFVSQPGKALVRKNSNPGLETTIGCNELAKSSWQQLVCAWVIFKWKVWFKIKIGIN